MLIEVPDDVGVTLQEWSQKRKTGSLTLVYKSGEPVGLQERTDRKVTPKADVQPPSK